MSFKNGDRIYTDDGHRLYYYNGIFLPSVTTVIGVEEPIQLRKWKRKNTKEYVDKVQKLTSTVGELIHYNSMEYMKDQSPLKDFMYQEMPDLLWKMPRYELNEFQDYVIEGMKMFYEFWESYKDRIRLLDIETQVYYKDDKMQFAGRFDLKFEYLVNGEWIPCLGDIKTSREIWFDEVELQLAAYNLAIRKWGQRAYVLRIHPYPDEWNGWEFSKVEFNYMKFQERYAKYLERYGERNAELVYKKLHGRSSKPKNRLFG